MKQEEIAIEELKLIESVASSEENIRLRIMTWGVTVFAALSVASLSDKLSLPQWGYVVISILILTAFFWLDVIHRVAVDRSLARSNRIEEFLRGEAPYDGPAIGKSFPKQNGIKEYVDAATNIRVYMLYLMLGIATLAIGSA